MATNDFIAVSCDDWYQRQRKDAEGRFFMKVMEQGPRAGVGDDTRQGIYAFTADGELLWAKNSGTAAAFTRDGLKSALAKFSKLPADRREPGAIVVDGRGKPDARFERVPPEGGMILRVNNRVLDVKGDGYVKGTSTFPGGTMSARDFAWITKGEAQLLAPPSTDEGFVYNVPKKVALRLARFHLVDFTRGEPLPWEEKDVHLCKMTLTVIGGNAEAIELRLDGEVYLGTDSNPKDADKGYEAKLMGKVRYRVPQQKFDQFDVAVVGNHWGESIYTRGARPGRTPMGITFMLVSGQDPADRIPPEAARDLELYFGKGSK